MSLKKPSRAASLGLDDRIHRKHRDSDGKAAVKVLSLAALLGGTVGAGTIVLDKNGGAGIASALKPIAVRAELARAREPQPGDSWSGCDDARAAGTAPMYSGEPGYDENMDGDGDGIACEPHR